MKKISREGDGKQMKCPSCEGTFSKVAYVILDESNTINRTKLSASAEGVVLICPLCEVFLGVADKGAGSRRGRYRGE